MAELYEGYAVVATVADDRTLTQSALTQWLAAVDALVKAISTPLPEVRLTLTVGGSTPTPMTLRVIVTSPAAGRVTADMDAIRTWSRDVSRQNKTTLKTASIDASID